MAQSYGVLVALVLLHPAVMGLVPWLRNASGGRALAAGIAGWVQEHNRVGAVNSEVDGA